MTYKNNDKDKVTLIPKEFYMPSYELPQLELYQAA